MVGWLDGWTKKYEKNMDGWMDKKNKKIWMVGWIKKIKKIIDGWWMDRKKRKNR